MFTIPYLTPGLAIALASSLALNTYQYQSHSNYKLEVENANIKAEADSKDRTIAKFKEQTAIQVESFQREATAKLAADAALSARDRVRGQLNSLKARLPTLTNAQCQSVADTQGGLFGACQERYRILGEDTNRLRNIAENCERQADSLTK